MKLKRKTFILFFVAFFIVTNLMTAQIKIGFSNRNQSIDLTKNHIFLAIDVATDTVKEPNESFLINIELSINRSKDSTKVILHDSTKEVIIKSVKETKKIKFSIDGIKNTMESEGSNLTFKMTLLEGNPDHIEITRGECFAIIETNKKLEKTKYNLHIGTNFDLINGFKANSFYSEMDVFLPNIVWSRWGIKAGIYKNNSVSTLKEKEEGVTVREIVENSIKNDSLTLAKSKAIITPSVSYENIGIYAGILYSLKKEKNGTQKFEIFSALNFEIIQRNETFSYEKTIVPPITTQIIPLNSDLLDSLTDYRDTTLKYYDYYLGVGLPLLYINEHIEVLLNPTLGIGSSGVDIEMEYPLKLFGSIQFYLMENRFGIKLSGDIRRYWGLGQDPQVTINISKNFNLTKIFEKIEKLKNFINSI